MLVARCGARPARNTALTARLPAVFFGHGSPMNALEDNPHTRAWAAFGAEIPRPRAILAISAHWYVDGSRITAMEQPPTIHDFGGFPRPLHEFLYPAPGDPTFAAEVGQALAPAAVSADLGWGLDHGTWSVLAHVYPQADIPVVQLSMDANESPAFHYELGRRLARFRDAGVLLIATGNVVHNLAAMFGPRPADDWAGRFEQRVRALAESPDAQPLIDFAGLGPDSVRAIPTPEHFLPLLYILGTRQAADSVTFPTSGIVAGAISMLSVRVG
jgi:4,5-DOPA dioxygenase extradiol